MARPYPTGPEPAGGRPSETYGVLGLAAGLLFGFFLIGRTVEMAGSLEATPWELRLRRLAR